MASIFDNNPYYNSGYQQQEEPKQKGGFMNVMGNVGQGFASGQGNDSEESAYSIDPNAGYKGSFKGLQSGGPIGAIVGGITSQVGTFSKVNKNLKALQPDIGGYTVDENGAPVFNAGAFNRANQIVKELQKGQKKIKNSLDPATHGFDAAFGTRKKLDAKEAQITSAIVGEQRDFNNRNMDFQRQQMIRRAYEDQIANVYGINPRYY